MKFTYNSRMLKKFIVLFVCIVAMIGCQTTKPPSGSTASKASDSPLSPSVKPSLVSQKSKKMRIESYEFIQTEGTDPKNPNLRGLEIKPANLPYKGKIASLSAQDRWMKMFEVAADSVSEICKPSKVKSLKFGAAELDYNSVDNDPRYPTYIQASFQCQ